MTVNITVDLTPIFANHHLSFSLEGTPFAGEKTFSLEDPLCTESELKAMLCFLFDKIYGLNTLIKFSKDKHDQLCISYYQDENTPKDNTELWMVAVFNLLTWKEEFLESLGVSSWQKVFNQYLTDFCSTPSYSLEEWIDQYLKMNNFLNEKIETEWPNYVRQWCKRSMDATKFNTYYQMFDFFFRGQEILHSYQERIEAHYLSQPELFPLLAILAEKQILNSIKKMNEYSLTQLLYQPIQDNLDWLVVDGKVDLLTTQTVYLSKALCFLQFDMEKLRQSITKKKLDQFVKIQIEDKYQLFKSTQALTSENHPLNIQKLSNKEKSTYLIRSYLAAQEDISNQNMASLVENFSYYYERRQSSIIKCMKFIYCSKYHTDFAKYFGPRTDVLSMDKPMSKFIFERIANPVVDLFDAYVESEFTISHLTYAALENDKAIFKVNDIVFNFADFNQSKLVLVLLEGIEKINDAENKKQKLPLWLTNFLMLSFSHLSEEKKSLLAKRITPFINNLMVKDIKYDAIQLAFLQAYFLNQVNRQIKVSTEESRLHLNLFVKLLPELIKSTQSNSAIKKKTNNENELTDLAFIITKSLINQSDNEELANKDTWKELQELETLYLEWKNDKNESGCKEKLSSIFLKLNNSFNLQASKNFHSGIDQLLADREFLKPNKPKPKSLANKPAAQSKKNKNKKKETKKEVKETPKTRSATQDSKIKKEPTLTNKEPNIKQATVKPGSSKVTLFSKTKVQSKTKSPKLEQAVNLPIENKKIESNIFDVVPIFQNDVEKKNGFEVTPIISQEEKREIPSILGANTFFNKKEIGLEPTIAQFYDVIKKGYPTLTWRRWEFRKELNSKIYCKFQLGINDKAPNKSEWYEIYFKKVVNNGANNSLKEILSTDPKSNQQYQAVCMQILPEKLPSNYPLSNELITDIFNHYLEYDLLEQFALVADTNEPCELKQGMY